MKTLAVKSLSELPLAAKRILEFAESKLPPLGRAGVGRIFCFYGELGAGKTTLIKIICKELGGKDTGSSPTYGLINEYETMSGKPIYHFDLFRIKDKNEAFDFGIEEYLDSGNYCFIEWPEKIESLLPAEHINVKIEVIDGERKISIS